MPYIKLMKRQKLLQRFGAMKEYEQLYATEEINERRSACRINRSV